MMRLLAILAAGLLLVSGCAPSSLAQTTDEDTLEDTVVQVSQLRSAKLKSSEAKPVRPARALPESKHQDSKENAIAQPETEVVAQEPPRLWMDMSMDAQLLDWFNETAYPLDIARVDHVSRIDLLENVEVGRRLVVFKNVADAEELVPRLYDKMDIIGYNLEHGPTNRPDEQADPVGSVRRMRALADEYGLELALGPDRAFALNDGVAMAPYVDLFVLQVQRAQTEPEVVRDFVLPLAAQLRRVNPELDISVQVRTEGDPGAIAGLVESMEGSLDGVSVLTSEETTDIAKALIAELRPEAALEAPAQLPEPSPQPSPTSQEAQIVALPTATPAPRRTISATHTPESASVADREEDRPATENGWLFAGGVVALGVLMAGLLATLALYAVQSIRSR